MSCRSRFVGFADRHGTVVPLMVAPVRVMLRFLVLQRSDETGQNLRARGQAVYRRGMPRIADPHTFDRFALDYDRFVSLLPGQNTAWLLGLGLKGERALDAGCGSGHAVEALADSFEEVIGLDLSGPLIGIAKAKRTRPHVRYVVEDLFGLTDETGFDLVYSHTMLHHLEDYRAGLEHLKSLVRPGGTVALVDNVCDLYPTPPRKAYTWPA